MKTGQSDQHTVRFASRVRVEEISPVDTRRGATIPEETPVSPQEAGRALQGRRMSLHFEVMQLPPSRVSRVHLQLQNIVNPFVSPGSVPRQFIRVRQKQADKPKPRRPTVQTSNHAVSPFDSGRLRASRISGDQAWWLESCRQDTSHQ
jgi:hypothetical protein